MNVAGKTASVLVIEDDEVISDAIIHNLRKRGYNCRWARDGLEGLRKIRQETPDLILLDLMLPGLDGLKLCEQLRGEGFDFPIIICSARTSESDKVQGLSAGADDFITKPFGMTELLARVEANLRRMRQTPPAPKKIISRGLVIDPDRREVLIEGESLVLTPKEFAVLHYIASCAPRTTTREEIYRTVWGYDFIPGDRAVDVFVRRIRKKLATKLTEPILITQYGFGYKVKLAAPEPAGDEKSNI